MLRSLVGSEMCIRDSYYTDGGGFPPASKGWKAVGAGDADKGGETLASGYAIQRKGEAGSVSVAIPNGLDL